MMKAKQLILKALDDLNLCDQIIDDLQQHDNVGYHMSQACEKLLKALCLIKEIDYPISGSAGHDLERLFQLLEENGHPQ